MAADSAQKANQLWNNISIIFNTSLEQKRSQLDM